MEAGAHGGCGEPSDAAAAATAATATTAAAATTATTATTTAAAAAAATAATSHTPATSAAVMELRGRIEVAFPGITVEERAGRGRCVVAAVDLAPGAVVLASIASAVWVTDSTRCAACIFVASDSVCTGCRILRYCSKACQTAHWRAGHKVECAGLRAAHAAAAGGGEAAAAVFQQGALLARLLRHLATLPAAACAVRAGEPLAATVADIVGMQVAASGSPAHAAAHAIAATAAAIGGAGATPTPATAGIDSCRLAAAFDCNNFSIADELMTGRAAGVFPLGALLNHACEPNTVPVYTVYDDGTPVQTFRTLAAVPAGTELCHSYVELALPSFARRAALRDAYGFECRCPACVDVPGRTLPSAAARDAVLLGAAAAVCAGAATPAFIPPASSPGVAASMPAAATPALRDAAAPWQQLAIASEHAGTNTAALAACATVLRGASLVPVHAVLPRAPHAPAPPAADGDGDDVGLELAAAEAALVGLRTVLAPYHMDVMAAVNVAFARAMLLDDTVRSVAACSALVACYRAIYAATPAHPMLALQLFTLGDLLGELAAYRGGVPRVCTHAVDLESDPAAGTVQRLAVAYAADGDAAAAAWFGRAAAGGRVCPSCCCTLHHWQRVALATRPAVYAECAVNLARAYGPHAPLPAMACERQADAGRDVADYASYGGTLCTSLPPLSPT